MGHYFENDNNLKSEIKEFKLSFAGFDFRFKTDNGVFSKGELDYGTFLLLDTIKNNNLFGNILDLGCGYGAIGIILKKIFDCSMIMVDINKRAVHLTKMNIKDNNLEDVNVINSDGYESIDSEFDFIVTNPPIRVGKKKLYDLIITGKKYLKKDGIIYLVIRKEQGANSFINDMKKYYEVDILNKSKGFYIISLKNIDY